MLRHMHGKTDESGDKIRVAVCVDGSTHARRAFDTAVRSVDAAHDELHLIVAVQHENSSGLDTAFDDGIILENPAERNHAMDKRADALVAAYEKLATEAGIKHVAGHVIRSDGDAQDEVVNSLKENEITHVFVGSRGLGAIKRFFLGSFSTYLTHHSPCTVTIVR
eukprot:TRINITY_DN11272_c0_g1_i2.p1 TRINITY_DN11272_c0_g1~~TRINITY_DN11272_c0_g1_i2.p1  ORF type:complete len:165 (-),score=81.40 TRINITY_DN11272_c0_g1_i2:57-551(-)